MVKLVRQITRLRPHASASNKLSTIRQAAEQMRREMHETLPPSLNFFRVTIPILTVLDSLVRSEM
jgi:hypothetical protein